MHIYFVSNCIFALTLQGEDYDLDSSEIDTLLAKKSAIVAARKATGSVLGWDVPSSCIKFSSVLGKGKFGDVFLGQMDKRVVMVKVLQPDCGQEGKRAFDRELEILRWGVCMYVRVYCFIFSTVHVLFSMYSKCLGVYSVRCGYVKLQCMN